MFELLEIDFSVAPDGATHYANDEHGLSWYKGSGISTYKWDEDHAMWISVFTSGSTIEIPSRHKTELRVILPQNDKEQMLCEQVLRMCRGEPSEVRAAEGLGWSKKSADGFDRDILSIECEYRAKQKPKFEVPLCIWEFIPKQFSHMRVSLNGETTYVDDNGKFMCDALLTFDTEGYDLPTVVHRPK